MRGQIPPRRPRAPCCPLFCKPSWHPQPRRPWASSSLQVPASLLSSRAQRQARQHRDGQRVTVCVLAAGSHDRHSAHEGAHPVRTPSLAKACHSFLKPQQLPGGGSPHCYPSPSTRRTEVPSGRLQTSPPLKPAQPAEPRSRPRRARILLLKPRHNSQSPRTQSRVTAKPRNLRSGPFQDSIRYTQDTQRLKTHVRAHTHTHARVQSEAPPVKRPPIKHSASTPPAWAVAVGVPVPAITGFNSCLDHWIQSAWLSWAVTSQTWWPSIPKTEPCLPPPGYSSAHSRVACFCFRVTRPPTKEGPSGLEQF
nr:uncharacterized protein LOC129046255 [Mirounga angustirostris]